MLAFPTQCPIDITPHWPCWCWWFGLAGNQQWQWNGCTCTKLVYQWHEPNALCLCGLVIRSPFTSTPPGLCSSGDAFPRVGKCKIPLEQEHWPWKLHSLLSPWFIYSFRYCTNPSRIISTQSVYLHANPHSFPGYLALVYPSFFLLIHIILITVDFYRRTIHRTSCNIREPLMEDTTFRRFIIIHSWIRCCALHKKQR